jgi:hypothetical protein
MVAIQRLRSRMARIVVVIAAVCGCSFVAQVSAPETALPRSAAPPRSVAVRIAFVGPAGGISVMAPDGTSRRRLTRNPYDFGPDMSRDGRRVIFFRLVNPRGRRPQTDLYIVRSDGSKLRRLTRTQTSERFPAWSPDGNKIAFERQTRSATRIFTMDADGARVRRITRSPTSTDEWRPAWSPDGRSLAYVAVSQPPADARAIHVVSITGGRSRFLVATSSRIVPSPEWAPSGRQLAYVDGGEYVAEIENYTRDLYIIDRRTRERRQLTSERVTFEMDPSWGPGGTMIGQDAGFDNHYVRYVEYRTYFGGYEFVDVGGAVFPGTTVSIEIRKEGNGTWTALVDGVPIRSNIQLSDTMDNTDVVTEVFLTDPPGPPNAAHSCPNHDVTFQAITYAIPWNIGFQDSPFVRQYLTNTSFRTYRNDCPTACRLVEDSSEGMIFPELPRP